MEHDTTEHDFEVSPDLMADMERRARRERDQHMAACLRSGYHWLRRGITSMVESLSSRRSSPPRQA